MPRLPDINPYEGVNPAKELEFREVEAYKKLEQQEHRVVSLLREIEAPSYVNPQEYIDLAKAQALEVHPDKDDNFRRHAGRRFAMKAYNDAYDLAEEKRAAALEALSEGVLAAGPAVDLNLDQRQKLKNSQTYLMTRQQAEYRVLMEALDSDEDRIAFLKAQRSGTARDSYGERYRIFADPRFEELVQREMNEPRADAPSKTYGTASRLLNFFLSLYNYSSAAIGAEKKWLAKEYPGEEKIPEETLALKGAVQRQLMERDALRKSIEDRVMSGDTAGVEDDKARLEQIDEELSEKGVGRLGGAGYRDARTETIMRIGLSSMLSGVPGTDLFRGLGDTHGVLDATDMPGYRDPRHETIMRLGLSSVLSGVPGLDLFRGLGDTDGPLDAANEALMKDRPKRWLFGIDFEAAAKGFWEHPDKIGEMLVEGAVAGAQAVAFTSGGEHSASIAGALVHAQNVSRQHAADYVAQRFPDRTPEFQKAAADHVYNTMMQTRTLGALVASPHMTEFLVGFGLPTGITTSVTAAVKAAKWTGRYATQSSKWVLKQLSETAAEVPDAAAAAARAAASAARTIDDVDPAMVAASFGASKKSVQSVGDYLAANPLIGEHWKSTVDMATRASDTAIKTGTWIHDVFDYQAWSRRLAWMQKDPEKGKRFHESVRYKSQMVIGELEQMERRTLELIGRHIGQAGPRERELLEMLDQPWRYASVPDELVEPYRIITNHALDYGVGTKNADEVVDFVVEKLTKPKVQKIDDAEKAALAALTPEQKAVIARIVDDPYSHIDVPPELQEALEAGIELAIIDRAASTLAGKMQQFARVRRQTKRQGLLRVKAIKAGSSNARVREAQRRAHKDLIGGEQAFRSTVIRDVVGVKKPKGKLQERPYRKAYVPHKLEKEKKLSDLFRAPTQVTANHPSAMARTTSLDDMVLKGMPEDPFKNWLLHAETAFPKYKRGGVLREVSKIMRAEGMYVRLPAEAVTSVENLAARLAKQVTYHEQSFGRTWGEIHKAEKEIAKLEKYLGDLKDSRPGIMKTRGAVAKQVRGHTTRLIRTQKQIAEHRKALWDLVGKRAMVEKGSPEQQRLTNLYYDMKTEMRRLNRRHQKLLQKKTRIQWQGREPKVRTKEGQPPREILPHEKWSKQQLDQYATKYSTRVLAAKRRRLKKYRQSATALHMVAQQHAMRRSVFQQALSIAALKHVRRMQNFKRVSEMPEALRKSTGYDWVNLADTGISPGAMNEFLRLTGRVGKTTADDVVMVPKQFAPFLNDMLPFAGKPGGRLAKVLEGYEAGMGYVGRPLLSAWRLAVTIPRFLYTANNLTSSVGLSAVALKSKALDPALQMKAVAGAILAAMRHPQAMAYAKKIPVHLDDGAHTLADVIKKARDLRLMSQMEDEIGAALRSQGPVSKLPEMMKAALEFDFLSKPVKMGYDKLTGKAAEAVTGGDHLAMIFNALSPAFHARWTENYQHFATFLGFLDNMSDAGIMKAFTKSSKWSANYNLLTDTERFFIKDFFAFYSWNKFIMPYIVKFAKDRPDILATVMRAKGDWEHYASRYAPVPMENMPKFLRHSGMSASPETQPQEHINLDPRVAAYCAATGQDPVSLSTAIFPFIQGLMTRGAKGMTIDQLLAPSLGLMSDFISLRDQYGRGLPPLVDTNSKTAMQDSLVYRYFMGAAKGVSEPMRALVDLYRGEPEELSFKLRVDVGRYWGGMDNHVARFLGIKPMSVGGMFDPATGGIPGMNAYMFMHHEEQFRERSRIINRAEQQIQRRRRIIDRRRD